MNLQSLSGMVALFGYGGSGLIALLYFTEIYRLSVFPYHLRFAILIFAVFNLFTVASALDRPQSLAPEMTRAMSELMLSCVLFWRAMRKRSERQCPTTLSLT